MFSNIGFAPTHHHWSIVRSAIRLDWKLLSHCACLAFDRAASEAEALYKASWDRPSDPVEWMNTTQEYLHTEALFTTPVDCAVNMLIRRRISQIFYRTNMTNMNTELKTEVYPRSMYIVRIWHLSSKNSNNFSCLYFNAHLVLYVWLSFWSENTCPSHICSESYCLSHHFVIFPDSAMMFPLFATAVSLLENYIFQYLPCMLTRWVGRSLKLAC